MNGVTWIAQRHGWMGRLALLLAAWIVASAGGTVQAALAGLTRVASGLTAPIFVTHAPGDQSRLFIVERGGAIKILNLTTGTVLPTAFLTIPGIDAAGEGGFLGMAFHPNYATNGKFYTYTTFDNGGVDVGGAISPFSTHIRQYTVSANPNVANAVPTPVLNFPRPQSNHVGGWIGFQPGAAEANLYIASGDGGNGDDNTVGHTPGTGNAQDITQNFLGKILRINVDGDDFPGSTSTNYSIPSSNPFTAGKANEVGDDEIWAYGLRNPFRNSFDRVTGDLWIGDVGQSAREEIDFQAANFAGGANYGWRLREGLIQTPTGGVGGAKPPGAIDPVYDYNRDNDPFGGTVVSGGYVYRGPDPTLQGKYFFLDSRNSATTADDNYWMFDPANPFGTVANIDSQLTPNTGSAQFPVSFGEDAAGNLYIAYIASGEIYRIATDAVPEPATAALVSACGMALVGAPALSSREVVLVLGRDPRNRIATSPGRPDESENRAESAMRTATQTEGRQPLRYRWKGACHVGWLTAALLASWWPCELSHAGFVGRERVATGLAAPMFVTHPPGDPTRLFIAERSSPLDSSSATAAIKILDLTTSPPSLLPTPFLSIGGIDNRGEGGLLGMAFHPDYATNGKFYVNVTAADMTSGTFFSAYVREYTVSANPNIANTSFTPVITTGRPASNHVGGWIGFSPNDGDLYIMSGDGGGGNDQGSGHVETGNPLTSGNGQNRDTLLGKTLRIDVDDVMENDDFPSDAARNYRIPDSNPFADIRDEDRVVTTVVPGSDEIWAYGLRNPFRAGFDRATGDLWIGDVGQERREEVDFQPGNSAGGANYGWRLREGKIATPTGNPVVGGNPPPGNVEPIWDYKQGDAPDVLPGDANFLGNTVIGGVPYRGPDPTLQGVYFFTDNGSNRIWTLRRPAGGGSPIVEFVTPMLPTNTGSPSSPSAISEDANGNVYITYLSGSVYRIVTDTLTPGNFDADADVDADDLAVVLAGYGMTTGAGPEDGDADGDGDVDGADLLAWQQNLGWSALNVDPPSTGVPEPASAAVMGFCAVVLVKARRARRTKRD